MTESAADATTAAPAGTSTGQSGPRHSAAAHPRYAFLWSYVLTIGRFTTTAVVTVVMAAYLEPRVYGVMALAMVWVSLAQSLAMDGPAQALVQRSEARDTHLHAAFWVTVGGSALMAALFAAVAPIWARTNGTPELAVICWALAPAILLNSLVVIPDAIMRRNMDYRKLALRVLMAGLISGVAGVLAAVWGLGVWALVIQQLGQTVLSAVIVWLAVPWRPKFVRIGTAMRDLRSYSIHSIQGTFAAFIANRIDAVLLGAILGPTAVGLYRFSMRITDIVGSVAVGGLSEASFPHLSRMNASRDEFVQGVRKLVRTSVMLSLPIFGVLIPTAPWLLGFIGPQWLDAVPAFQALCVGGALGAIGNTFAVALQASGKPSVVAWTAWLFAGLTAAAMWIVGGQVMHASSRTQAFATAATYCVVHALILAIGGTVLCRQVLKVPVSLILKPAVPATLASLAAIACGLTIQGMLHGLPMLVGGVATGAAASVGAAIVLLVADSQVSRIVRRLRSRGPVQAA